MDGFETKQAEKAERRLSEPEYQHERLFDQDPALLEAVSSLAMKIKSCPADPKYPDIEPQAFIVGGFVRDALLGKHPKDADVEVSGVSAERLESLLDQLFEGRVDKVGRSFGIFKIHIAPGLDFDVSIPRRESKSGEKHADFIVEGDPAMSLEDAARRRDFTFNSMAADILTGKVYDPFNGAKDLERGTLRVTDSERFKDDPLRVYRALQFAARMDLSVEPASFELLREMVAEGELDHLSQERITEEFKKLLLKSERPSVGFELAKTLGIIEKYYPELRAMSETPQEPEWHPEGDVWNHTMMALDAAAKITKEPEREFSEEERLEVLVGALCHDIGKPSTTETIDGKVRSLGHEEAGIQPTKELLGRLSFGGKIEEAATAIVAYHLNPSMHYRSLQEGKITEKQYANIVRRLLKKIDPVSWRVFIAGSESDSRGRGFPDSLIKEYSVGKLFSETILSKQLDVAAKSKLIGGKDIMEMAKELGLQVKPGIQFGDMIRSIENARDEGTISTREEAVVMLKNLLRSRNLPSET